jgi:predicted nucleotidyltransferase
MVLSMNEQSRAELIIPAGTQIVTLVETTARGTGTVYPKGSVGKIIQSPADHSHCYIIRFPDSSETSLKRHELAIRKHVQKSMFERSDESLNASNLYDYVIYRCIVGSRAFGLDTEASDVDRRGIYLPPAHLHWSLYGVPEQIENRDTEECYWELQKFIILALKANPNVLECLYTPLIESISPIAQQMLDQREMFLSRMVYQTYNGYALSQFRKIEQDLRARGEMRWKHVMHLLRLLLSGTTILSEGYVPLQLPIEQRQKLRAIKAGEVAWPEIDEWRLHLHAEFDEAFRKTKLAERPDYQAANKFLLQARREMAAEQL